VDVRVDYDHPDGKQKLIFQGGVSGTDGILHSGIGPFDIDQGTVLGYGKVNYSRNAMKLNFFLNVLNGDATNLLAVDPTGQPLLFASRARPTTWSSVTCARSSGGTSSATAPASPQQLRSLDRAGRR
jgi:hypothetical protein